MSWLLAVVMLIASSGAMAAAELQLGVAPLTQKVLRSSGVQALPSKGLELWGAGNEKVSIQLVITAGDEPLKELSVTLAGDLQGPDGARLAAEHVALMQVVYIPDPEGRGAADTELYGRPEEFTDPGVREWPDALPPLQGPLEVSAGANQPIWVKVSIPQYCAPGLYEGQMIVKAGGVAARQVPLKVHVWSFSLPVTPHLRTLFNTYYHLVLPFHGVERDTPQGQAISLGYWEMLLDHRLSPGLPPPFEINSPEGLTRLRDPRLTSIQIHLSHSEEVALLAAHGLLHKALDYDHDEPADQKTYERLVEHGKQVHEINPAAKIILPFWCAPNFGEATPVELLAGTVDVWCPDTSTLAEILWQFSGHDERVRAQLLERQALGEELWTYVCCGHRRDLCNFFINQEGIRHRLLFWQMRQQRLDGFLYWCTTFWEKVDPWEDIKTYRVDTAYGEGSLLYPGNKVGIDGPVSSQRLECILAGMQDIEYFELLKRVAGEDAVQQVIGQMTTDWTHYSKDDAQLEAIRHQIGETLAAYCE